MIKRGLLLGVILLLAGIAFASSLEINATNISLKQNYSIGDSLSGNFSLKVVNIEPDYLLTTNLGHSISLRDFLKNNSKQLDCEAFGCEDKYDADSSAFESASFNIGPTSSKIIGLKMEGTGVILRDMQINARLNFAEQNQVPLKITFGSNGEWKFSNESNTFDRQIVTGASNLANENFNMNIGSTPYCQKLSLVSAKKIMLGANFSGVNNNRVYMRIKGTQNSLLGECNFTASNDNSCLISLGEALTPGDYFVCIDSSENSGLKLGYKSGSNPKGYYGGSLSSGDYSIFAKIPKYLSAEDLEIALISGEEKANLLNKMQTYLSTNYRTGSSSAINCSNGCFLPVKFEGIEQNLEIINISLTYTSNAGQPVTEQMYNLTPISSTGSFSGMVDLSKAEFKAEFSGAKKIIFYLERESQKTKLFDGNVSAHATQMAIKNLYPATLPAGVPTLFFVDIYSTSPISSYQWTFGDGTTLTTQENKVQKTYTNITEYNLTVKIFNNLSETLEKSFSIETITPRDYLNATITKKNEDIKNVIKEINLLVVPLKDKIKVALDLDAIQSALNSIDAERRSATTDSQFLSLALRISELEVPQTIWVESQMNEPFIINSDQIDLTTVSALAGKTLTGDEYKEYIANWQIANVAGNIESTKVAIIDSNGIQRTFAVVYRLNVKAEEKAYLIVQGAMGIDSSVTMQQTGFSKTLELTPGEEKRLDMISLNNSAVVMYVSPEPSKIDIAGTVSPCNFNKVCEKNLKEDYNNCRTDCKPWPIALALIIGVLFIAIVAYIFVQVQFKKKYELQLFKSGQELRNLVEAIHNSKENNISEREITDKLIKNGWSKEQVSYAIKKSKGERTRPYEIIPMDKILAKFNSHEEINKKGKNNELPKKTKE